MSNAEGLELRATDDLLMGALPSGQCDGSVHPTPAADIVNCVHCGSPLPPRKRKYCRPRCEYWHKQITKDDVRVPSRANHVRMSRLQARGNGFGGRRRRDVSYGY